jgi:branched-chain amino acid transport system ATP-binding protein
MLKVQDIRSGYGDVTVLHDLNFEVKHEIFTILGANGAGKSTLMKTIAKVLPLKKGTMHFKGESTEGLLPYEISARGLAYVPQEANVFGDMTVYENLSVGSTLLDKRLKEEKIQEVLDVFPALAERINQKAGSLSGGEAQMVAFGRALMQDPEMILLDEPTAGLSPKYVDILLSKVKEIHEKKGVGVILTEQNAVKAMEITDRIMVLNLGKIYFIEDCCNCTLSMIKEGYCI